MKFSLESRPVIKPVSKALHNFCIDVEHKMPLIPLIWLVVNKTRSATALFRTKMHASKHGSF